MATNLQQALIECGFIPDPRLITPSEFKALLRAKGKTIKEWAKERGYTYHQVIDVLSGRNQGNFGIGHEVAVAIGLKLNPIDNKE